MYWEGSGKSVN